MAEVEPTHQVIGAISVPPTITMGTPRIGVRDYLASQHLWTAKREALLCREREREVLKREHHQLDRRHRSHATTAVLSSVAFLEAMINSLWQDAADGHTSYTAGIPDTALAAMRELWTGKDKAERMMTMFGKFQLALVCAGHDRMPEGVEPYQSVNVLIELRNALVHFKPEWHWGDEDAKLVRVLRSKITEELQFPRNVGPPFPNKFLSAGAASWACDSVLMFARDWHRRIGITNDFETLYIAKDPFDDP